MKTILSIFIIFFTFSAMAQPGILCECPTDGVIVYKINPKLLQYIIGGNKTSDTIRVVMLVSDDRRSYALYDSSQIESSEIANVYSFRGYKVNERKDGYYTGVTFYLDVFKRRLSKNIIVWQDKIVN